MAKLIFSDEEAYLMGNSYSLIRILIIGAISGLLFWVLSVVIGQLLINPAYCHSGVNSLACINSATISGDIAAILVAVAGVVYMVNKRMTQPLLIALATTISLWGIASWTNGLSIYEAIVWTVVCYILGYLLFSWITRYDKTIIVLVLIGISVIAVRAVTYL